MVLYNLAGMCEPLWAVLKDQNPPEMWGHRRSYQSRSVPDLIQLVMQTFINIGSSGALVAFSKCDKMSRNFKCLH